MPSFNVRLRKVRRGDTPKILSWLEDPKFSGYFLFGWFSAEDDFATMTEKLDSFLKEKERHKFYAIERIKDSNLVGLVLLQKAKRLDCRYVGFYIEPRNRRKGFGMEAMNQLVAYVFRTEKSVNRIEAGTSLLNIASQRALEKMGFTREMGQSKDSPPRHGQQEDSISYAMIRDKEGSV